MAIEIELEQEPEPEPDWVCDDCGGSSLRRYGARRDNVLVEVCFTCLHAEYFRCASCQEFIHVDNSGGRTVRDFTVCENCASDYYVMCAGCGLLVQEGQSVFRNEIYWCEDCAPSDGCQCGSPHRLRDFTFEVPSGTIREGEAVSVTMPSGIVDDEGIKSIRRYLLNEIDYSNAVDVLSYRIYDMDPMWTTPQGNFTKRLNKMALQVGVKLTPAMISEVGNIARRHTSVAKELTMEFTRDLTMPREEYANDGSCWWTDYNQGFCQFKSDGGIAVRFFRSNGDLNGRVWLLPIAITGDRAQQAINGVTYGEPTQVRDDHSLMAMFNSYHYDGVTGWGMAQALGQLFGASYRKVIFTYGEAYINGPKAWIIGQQKDLDSLQDNVAIVSESVPCVEN